MRLVHSWPVVKIVHEFDEKEKNRRETCDEKKVTHMQNPCTIVWFRWERELMYYLNEKEKNSTWVLPSPPLFFCALSELTLPPEDGLSDIFSFSPPFPPSHRVSLSHLNQTHAKEVFYLSILIGHFLQKSAIIGGSFAERDLRFKASYASAWGQKVKLNQSHAKEAIFLI